MLRFPINRACKTTFLLAGSGSSVGDKLTGVPFRGSATSWQSPFVVRPRPSTGSAVIRSRSGSARELAADGASPVARYFITVGTGRGLDSVRSLSYRKRRAP